MLRRSECLFAVTLAAVCALFVVLPLRLLSAEGVLDATDAADRMYRDFPEEVELLGPEELSGILDEWDEAAASEDLRRKGEILDLVVESVPEGYRLQGVRMLRWANPEIRDRVVELYVSEMARLDRLRQEGLTKEEVGIIDPSLDGEMYPDYLDDLAAVAQATFLPELYEVVLHHDEGSGMRDLYLATVNPETTLRIFLDAKLGERAGQEMVYKDQLYYSEPGVSWSLQDAFGLLYLLCERSPDAVRERQEEVLEFVRSHAKDYSPSRAEFNRPTGRYSRVLDFRVRGLALHVLDQIGAAADVYTVRDIMDSAPEHPSEAMGPNYLGRVGERIIQKLEAME